MGYCLMHLLTHVARAWRVKSPEFSDQQCGNFWIFLSNIGRCSVACCMVVPQCSFGIRFRFLQECQKLNSLTMVNGYVLYQQLAVANQLLCTQYSSKFSGNFCLRWFRSAMEPSAQPWNFVAGAGPPPGGPPLGVCDRETHVYDYFSDLHGYGKVILTRRPDIVNGGFIQRIEWISSGAGLTDSHGSWIVDEEDRLVLPFNCLEGTLERTAGAEPRRLRQNLPLHPTILWYGMAVDGAPDGYNCWGGWDDKRAAIALKHVKSLEEIRRPGCPPDYRIIPPHPR